MAKLPGAVTDLVNSFERLPGIGPKSATRLVFYLMNVPLNLVDEFATNLRRLKTEVKICQKCFGVSESELCEICSDSERNIYQICVVEKSIDVMAMEKMGSFRGIYHVLGGVLNPLEHVGPDELKIDELITRIKNLESSREIEIILALNQTMEGEATALYIKKKMEGLGKNITMTKIGSGLPMGGDVEMADQATLSRAMEGRREI